jgi:hypothetical protein
LGVAPTLVKNAAFNGQCDQANGLIAAARAMGANSPMLTRSYLASSCGKQP